MRVLIAFAIVACSKYEPTAQTQEELDELTVATFEEMARVARENPTCERWIEVNKRTGTKSFQQMIDRMQKLTPEQQQAFRAKYGERIAGASTVVQAVAQRCIEEMRNTPIEKIEIRPQ